MNARKRITWKAAGHRRPTAPPIDDPKELPYPGYAREKAALEERVAKANLARSNPLPGPLREAFAGEPRTLHGFTLQPVAMGLQAILVRIKSPLLDVVRIMQEELTREDGADESTPELAARVRAGRFTKARSRLDRLKVAEEELVETVFCFVHPPDHLRGLLDQGRPAFREAAMREIGDRLHPAAVRDLEQAVSAHYAASFVTAVEYTAPTGKDDGTVFTPPPPAPKTASAGGSPCSEP